MNQEKLSARRFVSRLTHNAFTKRISPLFLTTALLLSFLASRAEAQTACLQDCQAALAACMQRSGQDPVMEGACQDQYDACVNHCLGDYALRW